MTYRYLLSSFSAIACAFLSLLSSCQIQPPTLDPINDLVEEGRRQFAPDARTAVFDVEVVPEGNVYRLRGECDAYEAKKWLLARLDEAGIEYTDSLTVLPDPALGMRHQGLVRISVANLRARPSHAAEMVTQTLLGAPVTVLKQQRGWSYVQLPDRYIGWVETQSLRLFTPSEMDSLERLEKIVFRETHGYAVDDHGNPVSDLVAGNVLVYLGEQEGRCRIAYPDGRLGWIASDAAVRPDSLRGDPVLFPERLVQTARGFMGIPYLWGGTSTKGMDCSGFTKTVYALNGVMLPRDADQQSRAGAVVDSTGQFDRLIPGDLLFFGTPASDSLPERIVHVALWLGKGEYIHASGDVHVSSVSVNSSLFDAYNRNRYIRSVRIRPHGNN